MPTMEQKLALAKSKYGIYTNDQDEPFPTCNCPQCGEKIDLDISQGYIEVVRRLTGFLSVHEQCRPVRERKSA